MNRIRRHVFTVPGMALLIILLTASVAGAQQEQGFDEAAPAGWELTPDASVADGSLVLAPGAAAFRLQPLESPQFDIRMQYQGPGIVLVSYGVGEQGRYHLIIHEDGRAVLERIADDSVTELGASEGPVVTEGTWFTIGVSAAGDQHQVTVDGQTVIDATDPGTVATGSLGIQADGGRTVTVDSVTISGDEAAPPAEEPIAEPADAVAPVAAAAEETSTATADEGLRGIVDDFFGLNSPNVDVGEFALNLGLAALLSFILSRAYVAWGAGLSNRRRFGANFMLVTVTTTFIILVVRSSVALSLGLVGALSIVRFRAAIKDPEELAYMFLAIGIGIGLGDNQRLVTVLALAAAIAIIGLLRLFRRREADFNLHVSVATEGAGGVDLPTMTSVLRPHCSQLRLSRYDETPAGAEAAFLAEFRGPDDLHAAREALRTAAPDMSLTFLDNQGLT